MKILLATDGSASAQHAAAYVADLCRRLKEESQVVVLYVKDVGSVAVAMPAEPGAEVYFDVEQTRVAMDESANAALGAADQLLKSAGATVKALAPWGRPAELIVETADTEAADLIALGSSGMGQITGFFLGSVSDRVLHRSRRPVLIIRGPSEG